ncbi:MAG TPA: aspartyl/asparaginyl beta-hydroxylase domain-containing protein [Gammaproteobacteria bacterium]|nr:aspartyl/asparaginyl beta-hydroxylase domain-containing protein [Gammaproteobacteria bacterium]
MNRPNQTPDPAAIINVLADSAKALADRGELQEAEKVYLKILEAAPYHVRALSFLAGEALARGDLDASQAYLDRALRVAPDLPVLHQNMGLLQKQRGDLDAALVWFDQAITIKPDHRFAHFHRGATLQELGRNDEAVLAYWQAWRHFPNADAAVNDRFTPLAVRELLAKAAESIRLAQWRLFGEHIAPVQERFGKDALSRVYEAAEIYVGLRKAAYAHALQRPAFIYMPGLHPQSFFDRSQFDWAPRLESATAEILVELQSAFDTDEGFTPYVQVPKDEDPQQWRPLDGSRSWSALHLYKAGARVDANCERCPKTAALVESLQLPMIPGHAPEALFSVLQPGTHIPPHFGLANYKLVAHLPLIVPQDCAIRVGNETRGWTDGECLVFDDSFQHEAWNHSSERRAVLILDVWHPEVTQAEREGITALIASVASFKNRCRQAGSP